MDKNNKLPFLLLCGESGSGKTTVSQILKQKYNLIPLDSYTTRPPRQSGEKGHIFVTDEEFDKIPVEEIVAFTTLYDGIRYCGTQEQVAKSDIYVIDPKGIQYFRKKYKGDREYIVVYLKLSEYDRLLRMQNRQDSIQAINKRMTKDKEEFKEVEKMANYILVNNDSTITADKIWEILNNKG